MRTAFSVAVLLGLTYGQSYSRGRNFNPYSPTKSTPAPEPEDEDTRPEDCKAKIESLDGDLDTAESTCTDQRATLAGLNAMLGAQSTTIGPITEQIYANQSAIAFSKSNNERQDMLIGDDVAPDPLSLLGRIDALEETLSSVDGLETMLQMLQNTIDEYNTTIADIEEQETKLNGIMATVMANTEAVELLAEDSGTMAGSVSLLVSQTGMLEQDYMDTETDITTAQNASDTNAMNNETNSDSIDTLMESIAKLVVTGDFYQQNDSQLIFNQPEALVDSNSPSSFCVDAGVYYEFYANLAASPDVSTQVTKFFLENNDMTVLAASEIPEDVESIGENSRNRDHAILYKGFGDGNPLSVKYGAITGSETMATAEAMGFSWGVKVFSADFDFNIDDPERMCT